MKAQVSLAALALGLTLAGCNSEPDLNQVAATSQNTPLPTITPPAGQDWTQTFEATPEGGFRMGNPNAPVKLVEYASITCPHCAQFNGEASEPLREQFVRSGQVSWEFRPFLIFPSDPGIFLLLRCQGPQAFFTLADQLYATQAQWTQRMQQTIQAQGAMPADQDVGAFVTAAGVDQFFRQNGMPAGRVQSCLADRAALQTLLDNTRRYAEQDGVTGTPAFFINGQQLDGVGNWRAANPGQSLEMRLRAAVGSGS